MCSDFFKHLMAEVLESANNNHDDNYDHYRFGKQNLLERQSLSLKQLLISKLRSQGFYNNFNNILSAEYIKQSDINLSDFTYLYGKLQNIESRNLIVKIVAFLILGHKKVKLPLNNKLFWDNMRLIESEQSKTDFIDMNDFRLALTDLKFLGIPIKMYYSAYGVNIDFIVKQYEYHVGNIHIKAEPGEVVIDAGGCYGDTALYFSNMVSPLGSVHVFEFIPENIQILNKNLQLNPDCVNNIKLVTQPLSSTSNDEVYYQSNGPASKVSFVDFEGRTGVTKTISIDDYVQQQGLELVGFIKMDIEGAELSALKGAVQTIRRFRPKLAIALYHSTADFDVIPRFLDGLDLGYQFYLSHSTIHAEETMLFAVTKS